MGLRVFLYTDAHLPVGDIDATDWLWNAFSGKWVMTLPVHNTTANYLPA